MLARLIQRTALRLLSAGVFSFCALTVASAPAGEAEARQARQEAIKVELALLSDATAYAQPLTVRVEGDGVEVQGTVASDAVRQRVLEIARRNCLLPIHDRIAVPGDTTRAMAPVVQSAHDRLVHELGAQADAIKIQPQGNKLKLSGRVRSAEDKLHAGRTLRGLPGCTGLLNELEVKSEAGPSFTLVMHGEEAVPAAPVATLPSGLPPARVAPVAVESPGWGKGYVPPAPVAAPPVAKKQPAPARVPEAKLAPVAPLVAAPVVQQIPAPTVTEWPPAHRTGPATPLPAGALYQSHPLANLLRTQAAPESRPAELRPVAAVTPQVVQAPEAVKKPQAVKKAQVAKAPEVVKKPEVAKKPQAVRMPVVPKPAAGELVRKVKAAAGTYARDVHAETGADGVLGVHVYATVGSEQMLTTKLYEVPELMQINVRLYIHLAK